MLETSPATVGRVRERSFRKGLEAAPKKSAAFAWWMEEILDPYEEPYDPKRPVVCFDDRPCQLLAEVRETLAGGSR
jgi:hypothetical protein